MYLYNAYLTAINEDTVAQGWIENSCINTLNGGDNVNLKTILPEIRKIAVRGGKTVNDSSELTTSGYHASVNNTVIIIVISSIALVTVLGTALMIKRRKEDR